MQFRGGMNEMMRQAARMQRKVEQAKEQLKDKELTSTAIGVKVKATITYGKKVVRIEIDPAFLQSEGLELALDGVCAAINTGLDEAGKAMDAEVEKVTGGIKIPGVP